MLFLLISQALKPLPTEVHLNGREGYGKALNHSFSIRVKGHYGEIRTKGGTVFWAKGVSSAEEVWERAKESLTLYGDSSVLVAVWKDRRTVVVADLCAFFNFSYGTPPESYEKGDTLMVRGKGWRILVPPFKDGQRRGPILLSLPSSLRPERVRGYSYRCSSNGDALR